MSDPNRTQMLNADPNRTMMGTAPTIDATVTIKPVQCPICKTFNPAGMMFCVDCGLIFDRALPDDAFGAPAIQLPQLVETSGREHPVRLGLNTIGREGDIAIPDPRVSRRHAQIESADGVFFVEDLGSTNGTTLNGAPLSGKQPFTGEDALAFGGVEVRLRLPGTASAGATQTLPSNRTAPLTVPPMATPPVAFLVVGEDRHALMAGANPFGRKPGNAVVIADPYVSGKHGLIEVEGDSVYLTDLGSTNGTVVDDAKLTPNIRTCVTPSNTIRLGSLELHIEFV